MKRHRLLRRLRGRVDAEILQRCIEDGDSVVHEAVLEYEGLERKHLEELARIGANRRVRNVAKQRLARQR